MPGHSQNNNLSHVQKCVTFLKDLEMTWNGASRSRAIIEQLMSASNSGHGSPNRRALSEFQEPETLSWDQIPGSEMFGYDVSGADLLHAWLP